MEALISEYICEIWHDKGRIRVKTTATSMKQAKEQIAAYEGCPVSAIRIVSGKTL